MPAVSDEHLLSSSARLGMYLEPVMSAADLMMGEISLLPLPDLQILAGRISEEYCVSGLYLCKTDNIG
ncbi:hypothetical protein PHJA_002828500 [Phtheirospermum japonicum]|uniref:Uncharacterized protein n=1 Tax=Phtheirospermum japonicum TaxID=374723 RepID=A0A830DED6_9LAMI|nr:hypothetical protein PHJA_002828500 [Phtheirospermum japonicum]